MSSTPLFRRSYAYDHTNVYAKLATAASSLQLRSAMEQTSSSASIAGRDIQTVHKTAEVTVVLLRLRRSGSFVQHGGTTSYLLTYLL